MYTIALGSAFKPGTINSSHIQKARAIESLGLLQRESRRYPERDLEYLFATSPNTSAKRHYWCIGRTEDLLCRNS